MKVSLNGLITDKGKANIPAESDGLYYGLGCFETFKCYKGKFLHLDRHLVRMNDAVTYLSGLEKKWFSEESLRSEIAKLLDVNNLTDGQAKIRIQVSLSGRHGYALADSKEPQIMTLITAEEIYNMETEPVQLASVETTVVPTSCRPTNLKLSNMLHYRQAAIEAKGKGADDGLMLTVHGDVAETSIANIFWEKNGTVFTPSAECDILPGVTRSILLDLIGNLGVEIREGAYSMSDIEHASQIWICNSIKECVWVSSVNSSPFPTDTKLRNDLFQQLEQYKIENLS